MDATRILLIGILYLAQLVVADKIHNKQMLSDGEPIPCGSRWKNTGVMYQIYYAPNEPEASDEDDKSMPEGIKGQEGSEDPLEGDGGDEVDEDDEDDEGDEGKFESIPLAPTTETVPGTQSDPDPEARTVYEYCIDEDSYRIFYTKYEIEKPVEMTPELSRISQTFDLKETETRDFYGDRMDYNSQLVVVPDFTPQLELRERFYKYDISTPLNTELINPWKEVIDEIKAKLHKINEPIHVYSGTYDTYRLHGAIHYINPPENVLPAPFALWILLYNQTETKGISVIMQNYAFSNGETKNLLCKKSICSDVGLDLPDYSFSHIYCCPAQTIMDEYDFTKNEINDPLTF